MSTKKKTVTKKITKKVNYARLLPKMIKADAVTMKLADALIILWNEEGDKSKPMAFRQGFIEFAVAKKYDKRWAMDVATKAGFRARAAGGGRKPTKPDKNTAEAVMAQAKALPVKELKRLMKMLAAL